MFVAGVEMKDLDGVPSHHLISGYPEEWQRIYAECDYIRTDPTVAHCQTSLEPLVWTEKAFSRYKGMHLWEEARSYGLAHGISVALHDEAHTKSMLSLVRDKPVDLDARECRQLISCVQVLAGCAHFVAVKLAKEVLRPVQTLPRLTRQEVECLKWVSNGKTSWEIARIMTISEPTVAFHIRNGIQKLGASNRPQALAIAIRLGLI
ncbi:unnamed protein product [Darwinula stevensoni]|uniref:HTH luxR-type domain-containing protein n=1 Tax=Darwinula stevensoni TaxID=69355 RepID=A0A7R9FTC2_9CRUS|nr:unnamed protein product [Darwinula stevensoni]CAG0905822.1 unnamed protein product [Darwinula stevensoni]